MLVLALTAVLSAAPPAAEAWAQAECPRPKQMAATNTEMKLEHRQRAECLRKAMDRALGRVMRPFKSAQPERYQQWMDLQADYQRWVHDVCTAAEEVNWVDLGTGERSIGTAYGLTENVCLQRQFAWRGFSASVWSRGDGKGLERVLLPLAEPALKARQRLEDYQSRVQQVAARAPAKVGHLAMRQLSHADWTPYVERLARVAAGPEALARRQCALLPRPPEACALHLANSLMIQASLSEFAGEAEDGSNAQSPTPP